MNGACVFVVVYDPYSMRRFHAFAVVFCASVNLHRLYPLLPAVLGFHRKGLTDLFGYSFYLLRMNKLHEPQECWI